MLGLSFFSTGAVGAPNEFGPDVLALAISAAGLFGITSAFSGILFFIPELPAISSLSTLIPKSPAVLANWLAITSYTSLIVLTLPLPIKILPLALITLWLKCLSAGSSGFADNSFLAPPGPKKWVK